MTSTLIVKEASLLGAGRAFDGWQEGRLSFPPTFKFLRGTTQYHGEGPEPDPANPRAADEPAGDAVCRLPRLRNMTCPVQEAHVNTCFCNSTAAAAAAACLKWVASVHEVSMEYSGHCMSRDARGLASAPL